MNKDWYNQEITSGRLRWMRHAAHMRDIRHAHNIWDGKPEGRRPLARTMHRREDDIKMDITELECDSVDC